MKKFTLKSGNTTPFKKMGSSPVKNDPWDGKQPGSYEKHKATTPSHGGKPENYYQLKESGQWDKWGEMDKKTDSPAKHEMTEPHPKAHLGPEYKSRKIPHTHPEEGRGEITKDGKVYKYSDEWAKRGHEARKEASKKESPAKHDKDPNDPAFGKQHMEKFVKGHLSHSSKYYQENNPGVEEIDTKRWPPSKWEVKEGDKEKEKQRIEDAKTTEPVKEEVKEDSIVAARKEEKEKRKKEKEENKRRRKNKRLYK